MRRRSQLSANPLYGQNTHADWSPWIVKNVVKQVYKITYPTGKIYIGKDSIGSARYMGSPDPAIVNADFAALSDDERRDYVIRKEILWESEEATEEELSAKEVEMIRMHRSNDPSVGYNRWPKFFPGVEDA